MALPRCRNVESISGKSSCTFAETLASECLPPGSFLCSISWPLSEPEAFNVVSLGPTEASAFCCDLQYSQSSSLSHRWSPSPSLISSPRPAPPQLWSCCRGVSLTAEVGLGILSCTWALRHMARLSAHVFGALRELAKSPLAPPSEEPTFSLSLRPCNKKQGEYMPPGCPIPPEPRVCICTGWSVAGCF